MVDDLDCRVLKISDAKACAILLAGPIALAVPGSTGSILLTLAAAAMVVSWIRLWPLCRYILVG